MLTLWQTEWCRGSQRVRQRLTELGVDVVLRQVPVEPDERLELLQRYGGSSVPVLEVENGCVIFGTDDILAWLDEHHVAQPDAAEHRARAERSLAKRCAELHTHA